MTIKNNGGIFGRNPTFNDVTIEGQLTFDGDIDVNSDLKVDGNLFVTGTGDFDGDLNVNAGSIVVDAGKRSGANTFSFEHSTAEMYLYNVTTASPVINFKNNSNVHINSGNLVFGTAGNGIDFSATSDGTGNTSSELLDDYEEGTFTPTYIASGTDFDSVSYAVRYGNYVKIGSLIFVTGFIRTSSITLGSASGSVRIGGLPFTRIGSMSPPGICQGGSWAGDVPRSCISFTDATLGLYFRTAGNTDDSAIQIADLNTSGNNDLYFSCMFRESY
jgi:hypothetical protein